MPSTSAKSGLVAEPGARVANGWIEITAGLDGGDNIRLPA
jgi:hypothetical protein